MSVQSEINRISGNVTAALSAIAEKGVSVPSGSKSDALAALITAIETGGGGSGDNVQFNELTTTPAETVTTVTFQHGLGKAPNIAVLFYSNESTYATSVGTSMVKTHLAAIYTSSKEETKKRSVTYSYSASKLQISSHSPSISADETQITFTSYRGCDFLAGMKYTLIVA